MQAKTGTDLIGVDISSLQTVVNEPALFESVKFLYARAYGSDHTGTGDTAFEGYITMARNNNCPIGAYYFATPFVDANNTTDAQLITQAQGQCQQFIDKLHGGFGAGNVGDLIPFVDLETYTDNHANQGHTPTSNAWYPQSVMTSAQFVTWVKAFRDYFWTQTGRRVGVYCNAYWLTTTDLDSGGNKQGIGLTTAQINDINSNNEMPLWLAQYDQYSSATTQVTPPDLGNWTTWNAWQYTGTGNASAYGLSHPQNYVDIDRCSDLSWIEPPPIIDNWGITDNQDGSITITVTHPTVVDYIGSSVYQDGTWVKWISPSQNSIQITGLTAGQTYTFKLMTEDTNHDMSATADRSLTLYSPPPTPTTVASPDPNGTGTTGTTQKSQPTPEQPSFIATEPEVYGNIDITQYPELAQTRSFILNGLDSRNFGFLINSIARPFLPPISVSTISVPNRAGVLAFKNNVVGQRDISVDITLMGNSWEDLRQRVRNLAGFLIYQQDVPLIFSDEPNLQYKARFNATKTDLAEIAETGEGTIVFSCFDPLAYSTTQQTHLLDDTDTNGLSYTAHNAGSAECYPILRAVPSADCAYIKFTNETTGKSITYNATWTANDILMIDCQNNLVYRDSDKESFIENITLDSDFFPLVAGDNKITVENGDPNGTGLNSLCRVYWTEAYY